MSTYGQRLDSYLVLLKSLATGETLLGQDLWTHDCQQ